MLPLTGTYDRTLPNIKQITRNQWFIMKTSKALEKTFSIEIIITFRENKSLKQTIEGNTTQNDKNIKKFKAANINGNVHLVNLEYSDFVAYKMSGCLTFPTKLI